VNAVGVANALSYAREHDIPFVYISTAGIFDGKKSVYSEGDQPNPLSIYGKSKYLGELIAKSYRNAIVVRAGWMMGGGPKKDKKFVNKIIKQLVAGAKTIYAISDKLGTPCYTYDLAKTLEYLIQKRASGVFHGACDGGASRFDVTEVLIDALGLSSRVILKEKTSAYFKRDYFAPRPPSEQLRNVRLKRMAPQLTRSWQVCVQEYAQRFEWLGNSKVTA
jgi:dTDP-4-dehydrorhamnose reductase